MPFYFIRIRSFHANAGATRETLISMSKIGQTVVSMMDKAHQKKVLDNQHYLKTVADVLRLTCTQNIAQRGHNENKDSFNRGNFLEILTMVSKHDEIVHACLHGSGNAKYTHHSIQNTIISIMGDLILNDIKEEILKAEFYSIITDETKDLAKKEQLTLVLRYIYENEIHKEFLSYMHATSLTEFILSNLNKWGINIQNCISQSYDGTSVMSGALSGVQIRICEHATWALYIHYAHRLNLVVVDTCKSIKEAFNFLSFSHIYSFVSRSICS